MDEPAKRQKLEDSVEDEVENHEDDGLEGFGDDPDVQALQEADQLQQQLERGHDDVADVLKDEIWPDPLRWYKEAEGSLGAGLDFDQQGDEFEGEDEYEDGEDPLGDEQAVGDEEVEIIEEQDAGEAAAVGPVGGPGADIVLLQQQQAGVLKLVALLQELFALSTASPQQPLSKAMALLVVRLPVDWACLSAISSTGRPGGPAGAAASGRRFCITAAHTHCHLSYAIRSAGQHITVVGPHPYGFTARVL
eukprot:gene9528-9691_t